MNETRRRAKTLQHKNKRPAETKQEGTVRLKCGIKSWQQKKPLPPQKKKKKDTLSFIEKSGKAIKILELNTDKLSSLLPFLRPKNRRNYTKTVVYLCY